MSDVLAIAIQKTRKALVYTREECKLSIKKLKLPKPGSRRIIIFNFIVAKWEDCKEWMRLVIPKLLQQDFLHHYYISLEGGHQGIGRTYQRTRANSAGEGYIGVCNVQEWIRLLWYGQRSPISSQRITWWFASSLFFHFLAMENIPCCRDHLRKHRVDAVARTFFTKSLRKQAFPELHRRLQRITRNVYFGGLVQAKKYATIQSRDYDWFPELIIESRDRNSGTIYHIDRKQMA